jgi:hypothetical protein
MLSHVLVAEHFYLVIIAGGSVGHDAGAGVVRVHGPAAPSGRAQDTRQQLGVQTQAATQGIQLSTLIYVKSPPAPPSPPPINVTRQMK